jgi:arylsulfatase A-like enzyme
MWNQRVLAYAGVLFVALCAGLLLGPCDPTPSSHDHGDVAAKKKKKKKTKRIKERKVAAGPDDLTCPECNVIVISIDALRADHLGAYGYERATSPNLDEVAKDSLVFENAISQSAWSVPSHASMFTGLLPREHGLVLSTMPGKLSKSFDTLAERLQGRGYRTAAFGGGSFIRGKYGLAQGFDVAESKSRNIKGNVAAAEDWLLENGHKPFFLFVHGFNLQRPYKNSKLNTFYKPAAEYDLRNFCRDEDTKLTEDELKYVVAEYDASIVYVDQKLEHFFGFMKKNKLFRNTIVIVTSDNGEAFFEHGKCDHAHSVYRELTHVPLLVHLPSGKSARVADQVAASTSLQPTVLGMLGDAPVAGVDPALDLRAVVNGTAKQAYVISETGRGRRSPVDEKQPKLESYQAALSTPEWRLFFTHEQGKTDKFQLFAQGETPAEQTDQARKQAKIVKELKKVLFPPEGAPILPALDPPAPVEPATPPAASDAPAAPPTVKVSAETKAQGEDEPEQKGQ